jgi:hypothetical protein
MRINGFFYSQDFLGLLFTPFFKLTFLRLRWGFLTCPFWSIELLVIWDVVLNWPLCGRLFILNATIFLYLSTNLSSSVLPYSRYSRENWLIPLPATNYFSISKRKSPIFYILGQRLDCNLEKMRNPLTFISKAPCLGKILLSFICLSWGLCAPWLEFEGVFLIK